MVLFKPTTTVLATVLITILGHLRGLQVGYKYSYDWLKSAMNLQASSIPKSPKKNPCIVQSRIVYCNPAACPAFAVRKEGCCLIG